MENPLLFEVNSLCRKESTVQFAAKHFNNPAISAWHELKETEPDFQQSYLLIRATEELDSWLRSLSLRYVPLRYEQMLMFPRTVVGTPTVIEEAVFLQALHLLTFEKYRGEDGLTKSQSLPGGLSSSTNTDHAVKMSRSLSPEAQDLIKRFGLLARPITYRARIGQWQV